MKLALKPVFKKQGEKDFIQALIYNQIALVQHLVWAFRDSPRLKPLTTGTTDGNWNYIISNHWAKVYILAHQLDVESFLDLGSGAGFGMLVCKAVGKTLGHREIQWSGVERYEELALIASMSQILTRECDILKLTKEDIKRHDCLHMYEPAAHDIQAKAMVDHVVSIMSPHQTLLLVSTGPMAHYFREHPGIQTFDREGQYPAVNIYKLAEEQTPREGEVVARPKKTSRRVSTLRT